tara:strand:+ start:4563 stop:6212 length:1650 start_codon:yes stop_codon:yes gene_type:complete
MRERYNINNDGSLTLGVAASNASDGSRDAADFICSGAADEATINTAIDSLPASGGSVELSEGLFTLNGPILFDSNVTLRGQGNATTVKLADNARSILAKNKNGSITNGTDNVGLFDIHFDGNKEAQGYIEDIAIVTAVASTKKFAIAGNRTGDIVAGRTLNIAGGVNNGTFTVVGTEYVDPNTEIEVSASETVVNSAADGEMQMGEAYYAYLTGIHTENASGNQGLGTVDFSNVNGIKIRNVKVTNGFPSCIELRTCSEFSITNCEIDGTGDDGIATNGACFNGNISENTVKNIAVGVEAGGGAGIEIQDGCKDITCNSNLVDCPNIFVQGIGITTHSSGSGNGVNVGPVRITVANNIVNQGAIKVAGVSGVTDAADIIVTGNVCTEMYNAIIFDDTKNCVCTNNTVHGYNNSSVALCMIRVTRSDDIIIAGNIGSTASSSSSGALVELRDVCDGILIHNNLTVDMGYLVMSRVTPSAIANLIIIGNVVKGAKGAFYITTGYAYNGMCKLNTFDYSVELADHPTTDVATISALNGTLVPLSNSPSSVDA